MRRGLRNRLRRAKPDLTHREVRQPEKRTWQREAYHQGSEAAIIPPGADWPRASRIWVSISPHHSNRIKFMRLGPVGIAFFALLRLWLRWRWAGRRRAAHGRAFGAVSAGCGLICRREARHCSHNPLDWRDYADAHAYWPRDGR
jgi:hypothetical protein